MQYVRNLFMLHYNETNTGSYWPVLSDLLVLYLGYYCYLEETASQQ